MNIKKLKKSPPIFTYRSLIFPYRSLISLISLISFMLFFSLLPTPSLAQSSSLSIHPSTISLSLSPGKTTNTPLSIVNNGNQPLAVRIRFEQLSTVSDSSVRTLPSIGNWISLSQSSLLIPAKKEEIITIKIILPKTIPLGGYYGMLYVEQLSPTQTTAKSLILTKMGVLILGSVGVQDIPLNSIELQKPKLNTFISEINTLHLSFDVKNTALNHISAKPYLIIHPFRGKMETVELDERLVFPGTKRGWDSQFTVKNAGQFYYSADLFVSIGNGRSQKKSFSFIIFPVKRAIILVLCIAVGITIVRKRNQIKKAVEIIVRG